MDGRTDTPSYRDATADLKTIQREKKKHREKLDILETCFIRVELLFAITMIRLKLSVFTKIFLNFCKLVLQCFKYYKTFKPPYGDQIIP